MAVKPKKPRRLTISLDPGDYGQLVELAERDQRSLSWVIGQAVREFLDRHPAPKQLELPVKRNGGRRAASGDRQW